MNKWTPTQAVTSHRLWEGSILQSRHSYGGAKVQHVRDYCAEKRRCDDLTRSEATFVAALEASIA